jgi:hypothetical protein
MAARRTVLAGTAATLVLLLTVLGGQDTWRAPEFR